MQASASAPPTMITDQMNAISQPSMSTRYTRHPALPQSLSEGFCGELASHL